MGRKAITDMLNTCKGASVNAESEALKLKVFVCLITRFISNALDHFLAKIRVNRIKLNMNQNAN